MKRGIWFSVVLILFFSISVSSQDSSDGGDGDGDSRPSCGDAICGNSQLCPGGMIDIGEGSYICNGGYQTESCSNCPQDCGQCQAPPPPPPPSTPRCVANEGSSCTCGPCSSSGTIQCDGSCSCSGAGAPSGYGNSCNCGDCGCGGTITCSGGCSGAFVNCGDNNCQGTRSYTYFFQSTVLDNGGCADSRTGVNACSEDRVLSSSCSGDTLVTYRCNGADAESASIDCNTFDATNPGSTVPRCEGTCGIGQTCTARNYGCSGGACLYLQQDLDASQDWCGACSGTEWQSGRCCGDDVQEFVRASEGDLKDQSRACCIDRTQCVYEGGCFTSGAWSPTDNKYYCSNGKWVDPDTSQPICTQAFAWTGSRCCGDDKLDSYNEPAGLSACWSQTQVFNRNYVTSNSNPAKREIMVQQGTFEGCNTAGNALAGLQDTVTGQALVKSNMPCAILADAFQTGQHAFCSATGVWNRTSESQSVLKNISWNDPAVLRGECCKQDQCWNGRSCVNDQSKSANSPADHGFRCINGAWSDAPVKTTWDEIDSGFCPSSSQCLVNPSSSNANHGVLDGITLDYSAPRNNNIQCINESQYIGDNSCQQGNWSTRTKQVAVALLDYAQRVTTNYTLYCDSFSKVLNSYDYPLSSGFNVKTNLITSCTIGGSTKPCTNNFCVLKTADFTIVGTSLNVPINREPSLLEAFELPVSHCDGISTLDGQFYACSTSLVWFNPTYRSVVFSTTPISFGQISLWDRFIALIKTPFTKIFSTIINLKPAVLGIQVDISFVQKTKQFNRLYVSSDGTSTVRGVLEDIQNTPYLSIEYENFGSDVCSLVQSINSERGSLGNIVFCNATQAGFYISSRYPLGDEVWQDLTSKLSR